MSTDGLTSRIGFRLMAAVMSLNRRSVATEARVQASGVGIGQVVLDYACGPGYFTVVAARLVGPTGLVYARDREPAATRMVAERARRAGLANVGPILSDCATGLETGSVDVVLLYDANHGIDDKRAVLAELERVLKPGGLLSVWVEHGEPARAIPLISENSHFALRERKDDILNFALG
ncbi:MAG TPA: methyltransferase domain-containing protein [Candidatus Dormibacteraeota bacterium]|nr:methyltransferase domain-containing protein [Candidatus Dormibacteraeota bacterium]